MAKVFKRITASIIVISIMFNSGLAEIISYAETIDVNKIYQVAKSAISDFEIEEGVLIKYKGKKEVVKIPDEITIIGKEAFKDNKTIKEVDVPKSVTSIEDSAFKGCENLEKVSLKEGLFNIGNNVFEDCKSMKMIIIPKETSILGEGVFKNCTSLKGISLPKNLSQIGNMAFQGCKNIDAITIPNDISSIEKNTFKDCKSLKNVIILNKEFSISSEIFENIDNIKFYGQKNSLVEQISKEKKYDFEEIILIEKIDIENDKESLSINENETAKLDLSIEPKIANEPIYIIADNEIVEVTDKNSIKALKSGSTEISVFTSQSEVKNVNVDVNKSSKLSKGNTTSKNVNTRSSESGFEYYIYNEEVTITGYSGSSTDIVIPSSINNMPVTSIGEYAFDYFSNLNSIEIPDSVTSIGDYAFYKCSSLSSIEIPGSVTSIGKGIFSECSSLSSIKLPNSVTNIGERAFGGCSRLSSIKLPNSVTSIGYYAFGGCSSLSSIEIPASVTSIGERAFGGCSSLSSIEVPDSVTSIGESAFSDCSSLISIKLSNSVTNIGDYAFYNCSSLSSIEIPGSVTSIGKGIFSDCSSLISIKLPNSVTNIGDYAFGGCSSLSSIEIPGSVTSIGESAFSGCSSLSSIEIPASVTSIGNNAFGGCSSLSSIEVPDSVISIGESTFISCSSLSSIKLPNSVTNIGDYAFANCSSLSSIEIPGSVTSIGVSAFSGCSSLISIKLPNSVTNIGDYAFANCSSLNSIKLSNSIINIGKGIFSDCSSLSSIEIPGSVTSIGECAFIGCSSLSSIEIPGSVTSIGEGAFSGCSSLSSIEIPDSVTSIGRNIFFRCKKLTNINVDDDNNYYKSIEGVLYSKDMKNLLVCPAGKSTDIEIPNSVTSIGEGAFSGCSSLSSIEIPGSVTSIGESAFGGCSSLSSIEIPGSVTSIGQSAFGGCSSLSSIKLPNSITSIGKYAFQYCSNLSSIKLPNSVTSIGERAFFGCRNLSSIKLPNDLRSIGESAFVNCSFDTISIPKGITSIESHTFSASKLNSIYIPSSVTRIGYGVFLYGRQLTIYGIEGSFAQEYALNNKFKFEVIDDSYFEEYFKPKETFLEFTKKNNTMDLSSNDTVCLNFESDSVNYDTIKYTVSDESIVNIESVEVETKTFDQYDAFIRLNIKSGAKEGKCTITATTSDDKTTTCTVEVINSDYVEFKYASGSKKDYKGKCYYSDTYFYESSYGDNSKELSGYNPNLATASLCLAMSAFNSNEAGKGDYSNKYKNVKNLLEDLKFNNLYINDFYTEKPTIHSIGVAIGNKSLKVEDKDYTLIAVAVRGGGYESEWAGNFTLGESGNHEGFSKARDEVLECLREYINEENITGNVKIWITGYSRAAATANMTAGALVNGKEIGNINLERKDIYAYCFETPMGVQSNLLYHEREKLAGRDDIVAGLEYNNIFNIINKNDPVTKVAMSELGFTRYGVNFNLPVKSVTKDYETKKDEMKHFFYGMDSYSETGIYTIDDFKMKRLDISKILDIYKEEDDNIIQTLQTLTRDQDNNNDTQAIYLDRVVSNLTAQVIKDRSNYIEKFEDEIVIIFTAIYGTLFGDNGEKAKNFKEELIDTFLEIDNLVPILRALLDDDYETLEKEISNIAKVAMEKSGMYNYNTSTFDEFVGSLARLLIEFLTDNFNDVLTGIVNGSSLGQAHYPEVCLSWLMAMDKNYTSDPIEHNGYGGYRIISISCPIDIDVYDSNNNLVGSIKDNVPQEINNSSIVTSFNEDGEKVIYLPTNESYKLKLSATDDGEMNYSINEYSDLEQGITRAVNYQQIKIKKGDKFTADVPAYKSSEAGNNIEYSSTNYVLTNPSGTTLKADQDIKGEVPKYMVTLDTNSTEYGKVYGQGVHEVGRFAQVEAVEQEGYSFVGWYDGDKLVSEDKEYRFCVEKDITLVAHFEKESDTPVINPGNPPINGGGNGTEVTQPLVTTNKLIGEDRYQTAIKVSNEGWSKADNIIIVNSSAIVDALSATPFAKLKDAPILLTEQNKLNSETKKEISRLKAKNIYIIGGESVVSDSVINELKAMNLAVERISGDDRYETSLEIAKKLGNISEIAVVNGVTGLPDAVSIAPVAADNKMPIVLVSPNDGTKVFDEFIKNNNIKTSYVIGREKAISDEIASKLPNPQRLGGIDRNETNAIILEKFYTSKTLNNIFVAKDGMNKTDDLIDALAVGVLASKEKSPVVIVGKDLNNRQESLLSKKQPKKITQVGGNGNENAFNKLVNLFK